MNAHSVRLAGNVDTGKLNHTVITTAGKLKRNNRTHTLCAKRIGPDAQLLGNRAVTSCEVCLAALISFTDVMETDFGYPTYDDGSGRWV